MHDLNTSRYFVHDSARCGTSGNLTWKEVMHDFVFPRGITTLEDCILSRGILLGRHSDMEMEFDSVIMKNDQQVQTKLLSLSTTLRRWNFCLW